MLRVLGFQNEKFLVRPVHNLAMRRAKNLISAAMGSFKNTVKVM